MANTYAVFWASPSEDEHGDQYGHQLQLLLRQQGSHDHQVEDVQNQLLQSCCDEQLVGRPIRGGRLQAQGGRAELARGAHEHRCEGQRSRTSASAATCGGLSLDRLIGVF